MAVLLAVELSELSGSKMHILLLAHCIKTYKEELKAQTFVEHKPLFVYLSVFL